MITLVNIPFVNISPIIPYSDSHLTPLYSDLKSALTNCLRFAHPAEADWMLETRRLAWSTLGSDP